MTGTQRRKTLPWSSTTIAPRSGRKPWRAALRSYRPRHRRTLASQCRCAYAAALLRYEREIGLGFPDRPGEGGAAKKSVQISLRVAVSGAKGHQHVCIVKWRRGGTVGHAEYLAHGPGLLLRHVAIDHAQSGLKQPSRLLDAVGIVLSAGPQLVGDNLLHRHV